MVYFLETFAMVLRPWGKWRYLTYFDWKFGSTRWVFSRLTFDFRLCQIPHPEPRGGRLGFELTGALQGRIWVVIEEMFYSYFQAEDI